MIDYKKQGKKNRASGLRFEKKVRADLENKWIIVKWQNNIQFDEKILPSMTLRKGSCIPAKMGRFRTNQSGFPDFVCYKKLTEGVTNKEYQIFYQVIFVESKSNGYLDKAEKEKAQWYLDNNYCSKFLIASKGKKGEIIYKEWQN